MMETMIPPQVGMRLWTFLKKEAKEPTKKRKAKEKKKRKEKKK